MTRRKEPTLRAATLTVVLGLLAIALCPCQAAASTDQAEPIRANQSKGAAAIEAAARNHKYLFIFFWKDNDEQVRTMYAVFGSAMAKVAASADWIAIQITDPREKPLVDRFGVGRAPMPLVLALAPNAAVTKGLPVKFTEQQLLEAFVSPCTARCLKAVQDRKLVLLCIQNQATQLNQAALGGVRDFKADPRFGGATEVVFLDPSQRAEAAFLQRLQVDPRTSVAVTVLLAPPGAPVARFVGAVTKDQLVATVASAQSGPCAGGQCGPGGCGVPKK